MLDFIFDRISFLDELRAVKFVVEFLLIAMVAGFFFKFWGWDIARRTQPNSTGKHLLVVWIQKPHQNPEVTYVARFADEGRLFWAYLRWLNKTMEAIPKEWGIYCKQVVIPDDKLDQEPEIPPFEGAKVSRATNQGAILDKPIV